MYNRKFFFKLGFEILAIIIGISASFWISEVQKDMENQETEIKLLKTIQINVQIIDKYTNNRLEMLNEENHLMDYISSNWEGLNIDSLVNVLKDGTYIKSFHNIFLDYREFHPPISELKAIIDDGSLGLIKNEKIRLTLTSLLDDRLDFLLQNVNSEIQLQQAFRENLISEKNEKIVSVLKTSYIEMDNRIKGESGYLNKISQELKAIKELKSAENYLNLKIRQRYWVMFFMNNFKSSLIEISDLVNSELD
jgi:hypothetical protein